MVAGFPVNPPVQEYELAPLAVKAAVELLQILGLFTETVGLGLTVTVAVVEFATQPPSVPVIVYVYVPSIVGVIVFAELKLPATDVGIPLPAAGLAVQTKE